MNKPGVSTQINYCAITQSVIDTLGNVSLLFRKPEQEKYLTSLVRFHFNEVIYLSEKRFIIQGLTTMSKHPASGGKSRPKPTCVQVEYDFTEEKFYEAVYCANGTIRRRNELLLIAAEDVGQENLANANKLKQHLTNCLYSIEDCKSDI